MDGKVLSTVKFILIERGRVLAPIKNMRKEELQYDLRYERMNGKVYLTYDVDDITRIYLSKHDLYLLIDILGEKNNEH